MKGTPKNIPSPYKFKGTKIFRDTTALPFADGGPLHDRSINGKLLNSTYASVLGNMFREGGPFGENKGTFDYATSVYAPELGNYYNAGGHIFAAGGWPPGLKLKDPFLTMNPYYTNPLLRSTDVTPSATIGVQGQLGKKKRWTIEPRIGYSYKTAQPDKESKNLDIRSNIPISAGIDASFKGDPFMGGNALVDLATEYNPNTGLGLFAGAGYDFQLGRKNRRRGELRPGTMAANINPYGGINVGTDYNLSGNKDLSSLGLIYGIKGGLEWKPKKFPASLYAKGAININPVAGKNYEAYDKTAYQGVYNTPVSTQSTDLRFKPTGNFTIGAKIPIDVLTENLPRRKKIRDVAEDPYYNPGIRTAFEDEYQEEEFKRSTGAPESKEPDDTYRTGGMLKRADGSYSQRGLWDNIRENAGSGKKPTKQMLAQEKKINKEYKKGGPLLTNLTPEEEKQFQKFYQSLPDNLMEDNPTYDIRGYWDSEGRPNSFDYSQPKQKDGYYHAYSINSNTGEYLKSPAHETFQHAVDEDRKIGYRPVTNVYGRNIATENESIIPPEERSFLANTQGPVNFRTGGQFPRPYSLPEDSFKQGGRNLHNSVYASSSAQYPAVYANGGKINVVAGGEKHRVYIKESPTGVGEGVQGHVMVNHPTMDKGQWDTIDLTTKAGAKTVAEGIAATKKWHKENPNTYKNGGGMSSHFYASNVPDNNISNKDLTYPENSYVYAQGGNLNNVIMNKYPNVTNILRSGIHINPANKGKFTASANAAGMGVQEFASHVLANKDDYSSTQVKRANFAHNAAGWKHAAGGSLDMPNTMSFKYGGFNNPGFNALPKDVQAKIKARTFANGGTMPQLTEFNEGGRHEENPLGGIPQGVAGDGKLNLVEEGETKLNVANYIFSDTLKLDEEIATAFNLPKKYVGKTFAEISKKLNRPNSRRDNDTIEQNAIQRDLENLMLAQEASKQIDLQKDIEMMKTKHPEFMGAIDAAMQQQSAQQQEPSPEEMQQGAPQPGSPEEQAMMEQQMMAQQEGMAPEEMAQIPMSYGGTMFMRGGKMCYANGGHMYRKGGQVLRSIGAGAYGIGEGVLDAVSMGFTDDLTDKGYDALANLGDRSKQDLERDKMIRGFGNTAGAIGGAIVNPAATGSAISEGFEGLGAGLTGINGTNANFDKTVNSLAQVGSMAGSFVGGNPTDALGGLGKVQQNPFLQQVTGMKNGGHMYPTIYPRYKNNAGPMGQGLTNTQIYNYGGSFENPRQQMYMPLDNVEEMGGYLYAGGGDLDGIDPKLMGLINNTGSLIGDDAYLKNPEAAIMMGFDPDLVSEWTDPNTGEYEVPPAYRINAENVNLIQNNLASALGGVGGSKITMPNTNPYRNTPIERMPYLPISPLSSNVSGPLAGRPSSNMLVPPNNIIPNTVVPVSNNNNNVDEANTGNARININGTLYTKDEALKAAAAGQIQLDPEEINDYFGEAMGSYSTPEFDENNIKTQDEEDLENITYPGMSNQNIITGGKGDYTDEELLAAKDEGYLTPFKRAQMGIEDRNVNLQMKQTPLQALGLAAPIAYNLGMGLFSKPTQLKAEDYLNTSRVNPYKVNVNPQLNETTLAYNAAMQSLKNNAPGGGAYLTNMGNLANMRSKNMKEILAGKENADAQLQMQADLQNAQLNAQNQSTKFAIDDWNAKSKEAKRKYLEKAIEQTGTLAQNSQAMDAQERYMRLISPQYGKSFEYQNMFDQFMNYYKNKKDSNKEEE